MSIKRILLENALNLRSFLLTGKKSKKEVVLNAKRILHIKGQNNKDFLGINQWDNLKNRCSSCQRCRLWQTRYLGVFGSGNPDSLLWLVGEAPGAEEDAKGLPFVGDAGKLLTKMLQAIEINREDVFITNLLKCRPPENRNPNSDEILACTPYLKEQISLKKPKIILALGKFASSYFLQKEGSLSSFRGQTYEHNGVIILPTFHPSALLRNEKWKYPAWEDLKKLKQILLSYDFYSKSENSQKPKKNT